METDGRVQRRQHRVVAVEDAPSVRDGVHHDRLTDGLAVNVPALVWVIDVQVRFPLHREHADYVVGLLVLLPLQRVPSGAVLGREELHVPVLLLWVHVHGGGMPVVLSRLLHQGMERLCATVLGIELVERRRTELEVLKLALSAHWEGALADDRRRCASERQ